MLTVLDIETTFQGKFGSPDSDPSPYNPKNRLVSVGYLTNTGESGYLFFYHKEADRGEFKANYDQLQDVLNRSNMVIGHNLKFDMSWLFECNFKYDGKYYDTQFFEYICQQGLKDSLKLEDILIARELGEELGS